MGCDGGETDASGKMGNKGADEKTDEMIDDAVRALLDVAMSKDIANGKNLTQLLCTFSEEQHEAEHIGKKNRFTELFGHIKMGSDLDIDTGKEEVVKMEDGDEDFGM